MQPVSKLDFLLSERPLSIKADVRFLLIGKLAPHCPLHAPNRLLYPQNQTLS